jgi:hypothetical protein
MEKEKKVYVDSAPPTCRICKWENPPVSNPCTWQLLQGLE